MYSVKLKNMITRLTFFLCIVTGSFLLSACNDVGNSKGASDSGIKAKKERKKDHRKVDMVKRMTHFISKRVEITPEQEQQIRTIVQEYRIDSMSMEEFYYARLEMKDRILENVLTPEQKADFESK